VGSYRLKNAGAGTERVPGVDLEGSQAENLRLVTTLHGFPFIIIIILSHTEFDG
jgi:hypothetical protein